MICQQGGERVHCFNSRTCGPSHFGKTLWLEFDGAELKLLFRLIFDAGIAEVQAAEAARHLGRKSVWSDRLTRLNTRVFGAVMELATEG